MTSPSPKEHVPDAYTATLAKYRELVDAILDSPAIAGFCYTQLTDVEQETNGLLTTKRWPKFDPAVVREITKRPSASIPGDVIAQMMKVQDVTAFANASLEAPLVTEVEQQ